MTYEHIWPGGSRSRYRLDADTASYSSESEHAQQQSTAAWSHRMIVLQAPSGEIRSVLFDPRGESVENSLVMQIKKGIVSSFSMQLPPYTSTNDHDDNADSHHDDPN